MIIVSVFKKKKNAPENITQISRSIIYRLLKRHKKLTIEKKYVNNSKENKFNACDKI